MFMNRLTENTVIVSVFGIEDTIENHCKNAVQYSFGTPYLKIGEVLLPYEYLEDYKNMMWYKYFMNNHNKIYGNTYDFANEIIKEHFTERAKIFSNLVKQQGEIPIIDGDIFLGTQNVVGHQTNCQGVMGSGIAKIVKAKFPTCFEEYKQFCSQFENKEDLLGQCQLCQVGESKYIANLFGQLNYGTDKCYSDYNALKKALQQLKLECAGKGLSIALPFNISCGRAGGDWNVVYGILKEVFQNYPLILYRV